MPVPSPLPLLLASSPFTEPAQNTHLRCRWVSSLFPLPGPCLFPAPTPPAAASGWPPPRDRVPSPLGHLTSPNAPKREGSHGSQRQTDLPGLRAVLAGQALVTSSEDGPDDSGQEGGLESAGEAETVDSLPSRPYSPLPSPPPSWPFHPGSMVIDEGGGHLLVRRPGCELGFTPRCCLQCPLPTVGPRCQAQAPWGRPALSRSPLDLAASTNARARPKAGVWSPPHCPVIPRHRLT